MSGNVIPMGDGISKVEKQIEELSNIWKNPMSLTTLVDVEPSPQKWFIQDRIVAGRGVVVSGIGGSSKSRFLIHLAIGACIGDIPWNWEVVQTGRALLVLTEDTEEDFHRMLHNICLSLDITQDEKRTLYQKLIIYPLAGQEVSLLGKNKSGKLEPSDLFKDLVRFIQETGDIVFIGLDPALSITDGDDMDQSHQRRLGKMTDDLAVLTGAVVMLVAHASKNLKEEITSHNSRGGGALVDAVRGEFVMRNMTRNEARRAKVSEEDRHKIVQLVGVKGNMLPPSAFIPVWLLRDQYGNLKPAEIEFNMDVDSIGKREQDALKILIEMNNGGIMVKLGEWKKALIEAGIIKKTKKQKNQDQEMFIIRKKLFDAGMIKSESRGIWIPDDSGNDFGFDD